MIKLSDLEKRNKLIYGNMDRTTKIPAELVDRVTPLLDSITSSIEELDEILTGVESDIQAT